MSRTLDLALGMLSLGRTHQQLGRVHDALSFLTRLLRLRELAPDIAEETHARLGEIQLQRKKFVRARRHLVIALRYDPDNAHYHRLLAQALVSKEEHWERAARHFSRAVELDPEDIGGLTGCGLLCVKRGRADEGVAHLKRAVELKPADPEVLASLVKGLRLSGRLDEARQQLRLALFRNGRDRRFGQLWDNFQFRLLRRQQQRQRKRQQTFTNEEPVLLAFPQTTSEPRPVTERAATVPALPWSTRIPRLPGRRHVQ